MLSVVFIAGHSSLWNKMSTLYYHPTSNKSPNRKCGSGKRIDSHRLSSKHKTLSFLIVLSFILLSLTYLPVTSAIETLRKNGHTKKEMVGLQDEHGLSNQFVDPNHSTNTESSASSLLAFAHTEEDISILEAIYNMPNNDGEHPVWFNPSFSTYHRLLLTAGDNIFGVIDLEVLQVCHNFVGMNHGHCIAFMSVQGGTCCMDADSTLCSKIEDKFSEPLKKGAICTTVDSGEPSSQPSSNPSTMPSLSPSVSNWPTSQPSLQPSSQPSMTPSTSEAPSSLVCVSVSCFYVLTHTSFI